MEIQEKRPAGGGWMEGLRKGEAWSGRRAKRAEEENQKKKVGRKRKSTRGRG